MKNPLRLLTGLAAIMLSLSSHAVITDKFVCKIDLLDYKTRSHIEKNDVIFIPRLPLSSSPSPDVRLTSANITSDIRLDTPDAEINANLNFYYKQASKINAQGEVVAARQFTCMAISGNYCEKKSDDQFYICSNSVVACLEKGDDPFDDILGWTPTPVTNGRPAFHNSNLSSATKITHNGTEVGEAVANCHFVGTYE